MAEIVLAVLKTELETDPVALGYAAHIAAGDHSALAGLLNTLRAGASAIWKDEVPSDGVRSRISKAEFAALSTADKNWLGFVLGGSTVDFSVAALRSDMGTLFPVGTTRTAILALIQAQPTRGEELFGYGTRITPSDVADALR